MTALRRVTLQLLDIDWEGPFSVPYDREYERYETSNIPQDLIERYGFYQIYGRHPLYGANVLLYIGETKANSKGTRSYSNRFREHLDGRLYNRTDLSFHIGPCELDDETIRVGESILIATHTPALNRKHIDGALNSSPSVFIRNWGFLGALNPICSNEWTYVEEDE